MIATTDLEKGEVLNAHYSGVFAKEDTSNIPNLDPIVNVPQMMDIIVTFS